MLINVEGGADLSVSNRWVWEPLPCALVSLEAEVYCCWAGCSQETERFWELQTAFPSQGQLWKPAGTFSFTSLPNAGAHRLRKQQSYRGLEINAHHQWIAGSLGNNLKLVISPRVGSVPDLRSYGLYYFRPNAAAYSLVMVSPHARNDLFTDSLQDHLLLWRTTKALLLCIPHITLLWEENIILQFIFSSPSH